MDTLAISKLTGKNQVTVPALVRKYLGLKGGDLVAFRLCDGLVCLQALPTVNHLMTDEVSETVRDEWSSAHDERAYSTL